jgi:hypothetical protein
LVSRLRPLPLARDPAHRPGRHLIGGAAALSPIEIGLIVLIVLLIAGPKRITRLFRSAGNGVRRIRRRAAGEPPAPGLPAPGAGDVDAPDGGR